MPINPKDINDLIHRIGKNDPEAVLELKSMTAKGEYKDILGNTWHVSCDQPDLLETLSCPIRSGNGVYSENKTKSKNRTRSCFGLFFHRSQDAQEINIIVILNNITFSFFHGHDLRTNIFTRHGRPDNLNEFTKDVYDYSKNKKSKFIRFGKS